MSSQSNQRSNLVSAMLENAGWGVDPYSAGVIPAWNTRYPDLPIVADGRPCDYHRRLKGNDRVSSPNDPRAKVCPDCYVKRGRGSTIFDLFRFVLGIRSDFLSIKTETIEKSGKLPSKLSLATGNVSTLDGMFSGILAGNALPTVVFASKNGENGPEVEGSALFLDLGREIRKMGAWMVDYRAVNEALALTLPEDEAKVLLERVEMVCSHPHIPTAPEGGWGKGKAPIMYRKWSSRRHCGGKHKKVAREGWIFPCVDDQGRKWSTPEYVHYRECVVSLSAMGINRKKWIPCSIADLPELVEKQDWRGMAWGTDLVG